MCGRFIFTSNLERLQLAFDLDLIRAEVNPSYNVAPTQPVLTVVRRDEQNVLEAMRWGLIPVWAKDESIGSRMINARAETVAEKSTFKRLLKSRRCLIVADGFYEWQKDGSSKVPMFVQLKTGEPFGFAGLYDTWRSAEGEGITSCTIITTTPNALMKPIHNRMPVILPPEAHGAWLDPARQDPSELQAYLKPYAAAKMKAWPVSPLVNSPRNNSPDCIRPVEK